MSGIVAVPAALVGVAAVAGLFWVATAPIEEAIAEREARVAEIVAETAALRQRIAEFGAGVVVPELPATAILPGATRVEAGLGLQERLASIAEDQGVLLTGLQEGASPDGVTQPTVAVLAEGEGPYEDVIGFLTALEGQTPPLGLREVVLRPVVEGQQRVTLRLVVWAFAGGEAE